MPRVNATVAEKQPTMDVIFPLLDLPFEIRVLIYEWAVLQPQTKKSGPSYEESKKLKDIRGYGHGPYAECALTRVSKTVRAESLPIFYKLRRFPLTEGGGVLTAPTPFPRIRLATPHVWMDKVDPAKIKLMKSFAVELFIPHHRDSEETVRCILSIDLKGTSYDFWLGTSWGDNRFMPLDRYWNGVMTRESAGVLPLMNRLKTSLDGMGGTSTQEKALRLAELAILRVSEHQ